MPTTTRITIAASTPANPVITETLDDVISAQYGRHTTIELVDGVAQTIPWPTTPETMVYMRFPMGTVIGVVTIKSDPVDPTGWVFSVPIGASFVPILLSKPASGNIILLISSASPVVDMYFF